MKTIIIILLAISLFLVGCSNNDFHKISDCNTFCQSKGYNSGKCFDCVHLEDVYLPTECTTDNFIYNDIAWEICTEEKLKDNTQHGCLCE